MKYKHDFPFSPGRNDEEGKRLGCLPEPPKNNNFTTMSQLVAELHSERWIAWLTLLIVRESHTR